MKKIILTFSAIIIVNQLFSQSIPNSGFEFWHSDTLYENLSGWITRIDEDSLKSNTQVGRWNDAVDGNFSVYLVNRVDQNDTSFGYVVQGFPSDSGFAGFNYSAPIDSITFSYKCDLAAGDSAYGMLIQIDTINLDSFYTIFNIGGTQLTWKRFSIAVPDTVHHQIFFGLTSGNFMDGANLVDGSWIIYDNVRFQYSNGPTPPLMNNFSFENWDPVILEDPVDWKSLNNIQTFFNDSAMAVKATGADAYSGNYSLKLVTVDGAFGNPIGFIGSGEIPFDNFKGGFAYNNYPLNFKGYYKYLPVGNDTAQAIIVLSKYDTLNDSSEIVYLNAFNLYASSSYSQFDFTISPDTSLSWDSCYIAFVSSKNSFKGGLIGIGSALYLDELSILDSVLVATPKTIHNQIKIFPNPTNKYLQIEGFTGKQDVLECIIYNSLGEIVMRVTQLHNGILREKIDVSKLHNGLYFIELKTNNSVQKQRFIKN